MVFLTLDDFMANYVLCGCGKYTCETCLNYGVTWIDHRLEAFYNPTTIKACRICQKEVTFTDVLIRNVAFGRWYPGSGSVSAGVTCTHPACLEQL